MGLSAAQFGDMTPKEFDRRLTAETERENREYERLAQTAVWIINSTRQTNDQVRLSDLLKRRRTEE